MSVCDVGYGALTKMPRSTREKFKTTVAFTYPRLAKPGLLVIGQVALVGDAAVEMSGETCSRTAPTNLDLAQRTCQLTVVGVVT